MSGDRLDDLPVFPNEIFSEILEHADPSDDAGLKSVSSGFRDLVASTRRKRKAREVAESLVQSTLEPLACPFAYNSEVIEDDRHMIDAEPLFLPRFYDDLNKKLKNGDVWIYGSFSDWKKGLMSDLEHYIESLDKRDLVRFRNERLRVVQLWSEGKMGRYDPEFEKILSRGNERAIQVNEIIKRHTPFANVMTHDVEIDKIVDAEW